MTLKGREKAGKSLTKSPSSKNSNLRSLRDGEGSSFGKKTRADPNPIPLTAAGPSSLPRRNENVWKRAESGRKKGYSRFEGFLPSLPEKGTPHWEKKS